MTDSDAGPVIIILGAMAFLVLWWVMERWNDARNQRAVEKFRAEQSKETERIAAGNAEREAMFRQELTRVGAAKLAQEAQAVLVYGALIDRLTAHRAVKR